jgi:hypothetical protein
MPKVHPRGSARKLHPKEYRSYEAAKSRCNNCNNKDYHLYGGKGKQFLFNNFYEFFDHIGPRPDGLTLDRIDNEGDYIAGNVKWSSRKQQTQNRSTNVFLTYKGKTQCRNAWASELGISPMCLRSRLRRGWSIEKAFEHPTYR